MKQIIIMASVALTNGRVQDFVCPPDKPVAFLWAAAPEGFGVRASKRSKDYVFQGKLKGKTIRMTIGSVNSWLLDEAKEMGIDPRKSSWEIGIFGAEPWSDTMRSEIEQSWNMLATDIYGLSEITGPGVSQECAHKCGMHV